MEVYLAWSGQRSELIARAFQNALPRVIQALRPFFSPNDIEKGVRWNAELNGKLQACQVGLLFLTPESKTAPWILFEAGALSKSIELARVVPILFEVEPAEVGYPLAQFQCVKFSRSSILQLLQNVNSWLIDGLQLPDAVLEDAFNGVWEKLSAEVTIALASNSVAVTQPAFDLEQSISELLQLTRLTAQRIDKGVVSATILPNQPFFIGDIVLHRKFGTGKVTDVFPVKGDWAVVIEFPEPDGEKRLLYSLAGLTLLAREDVGGYQ